MKEGRVVGILERKEERAGTSCVFFFGSGVSGV